MKKTNAGNPRAKRKVAHNAAQVQLVEDRLALQTRRVLVLGAVTELLLAEVVSYAGGAGDE